MSLVKAKRKTYRGVLAAAPAAALGGDTYINSVDNKYYIYYGGQWQVILTLTPATQENVIFDGENVIFDGEQVKGEL
jgi:hypothetical protein